MRESVDVKGVEGEGTAQVMTLAEILSGFPRSTLTTNFLFTA